MKKNIIYIILLILFLSSCSTNKLTLGITKTSGSSNYEKYKKAVNLISSEIEIIDFNLLSYDSALIFIDKIDGLILSGGPDLHPTHFGKDEDTILCTIDLHRDSLELALIKKAYENKLPILGICRGLQILNVFNGGSLITDIPTQKPNSLVIHQIKDADTEHLVTLIDTNSIFYLIYNHKNFVVNSNHHQAIDRLADNFVASAYSEDDIIEAIENKNLNDHFVIAVQWHPERLFVNKNDKKSENLFRFFIQKIKENKK